jgi:hypothetical protein
VTSFELDIEGGAEVLKVLVADEIAALGQQIGANAGEGAVVTTKVTDRARASVTVPAETQAKYGALTKAAAAAGLEVKPYPKRQRRPRTKRSRAKRTPKKTPQKGAQDAAADDT